MKLHSLPAPFRGIVAPMVTPLLGFDELDVAGLETLIEHILAGGVQGLFILGSTGDGPALSYALRKMLIDRVCRQVAGRVPVLVGITDTAYKEAMDMAEYSAKAGAASVVLAPPYYFHVSQGDLLRLVENVSKDSPLPFYLYNMPNLTKITWERETVVRAADCPNVMGLKDSSGDEDYLQSVLHAVKHMPEFSVLVGPEHMLLDGLLHGVHGGVCGGANLFPRLFSDLFDAFNKGDIAEARMLQDRVMEIGSPLYLTGEPESSYIRGLKTALEVCGICSGHLARPLLSADEVQKQEIRQHLAKFPELSQG